MVMSKGDAMSSHNVCAQNWWGTGCFSFFLLFFCFMRDIDLWSGRNRYSCSLRWVSAKLSPVRTRQNYPLQLKRMTKQIHSAVLSRIKFPRANYAEWNLLLNSLGISQWSLFLNSLQGCFCVWTPPPLLWPLWVAGVCRWQLTRCTWTSRSGRAETTTSSQLLSAWLSSWPGSLNSSGEKRTCLFFSIRFPEKTRLVGT